MPLRCFRSATRHLGWCHCSLTRQLHSGGEGGGGFLGNILSISLLIVTDAGDRTWRKPTHEFRGHKGGSSNMDVHLWRTRTKRDGDKSGMPSSNLSHVYMKTLLLRVFNSALSSHGDDVEIEAHRRRCSEHAGPVGGGARQNGSDRPGLWNKCVTAGQNIDAANPRFVGGAKPNMARLARAGVVIVVDAWMKKKTFSKCYAQAWWQKFEDSVIPGKTAAPNGPSV